MAVLDQIVYPAFRIAGILLGPGFGSSPEQQQDALDILNAMVDGWRTQRMLVFHVARQVFNVVAGQGSYYIGEGAPDWNTERPTRIEMASLVQIVTPSEPPTDLPLAILTPVDWFSVRVKTIQSSTPQYLYYEPTLQAPGNQQWGTVWLWPVPQIANKIALGLWQTVGQFENVEAEVNLPPGYLKALQYNLAIELAMRPWLSQAAKQPMSPMAVAEARTTLDWVKNANRPHMDLEMRCESALQGFENRGRWDITSNQWRWG